MKLPFLLAEACNPFLKDFNSGCAIKRARKFLKKKYGLLYNLYVVKDYRTLAPEGWYIPSIDEWKTILDFPKDKTNLARSYYYDSDLKKQFKRSKSSRYRLKKPRWRLNFTGGGMRMWKGEYTVYDKYSNRTKDYETDSFIWTEDGCLRLFRNSSYFDPFQDKYRGHYIRLVKKL